MHGQPRLCHLALALLAYVDVSGVEFLNSAAALSVVGQAAMLVRS